MYNNVGRKVQIVSIFSAWVGIICGVLIGIYGISTVMEGWDVEIGVVYIVLGIVIALISYLSSLFLCAFGKLVDDISSIKNSIDNKVIYNNAKINEVKDNSSESLPE